MTNRREERLEARENVACKGRKERKERKKRKKRKERREVTEGGKRKKEREGERECLSPKARFVL